MKISFYVQSRIPVIVEICSGTALAMNMHGHLPTSGVNALQAAERGRRRCYEIFLTEHFENKLVRKGVEKQSARLAYVRARSRVVCPRIRDLVVRVRLSSGILMIFLRYSAIETPAAVRKFTLLFRC